MCYNPQQPTSLAGLFLYLIDQPINNQNPKTFVNLQHITILYELQQMVT